MQPVPQRQVDPLTGRQKECLLLLREGLTSKQIARELRISPRTVDQHIAVALENLGVKSRLEAVSLLHDREREVTNERSDDIRIAVLTAVKANPNYGQPIRFAADGQRQAVRFPLFPPVGGSVNAASHQVRIAWMVRLAVLSVMLTCLALLFILGLSEIVNHASG